MPNLHTCFCHKCNQFMPYPYQSVQDEELYHKQCLPENTDEWTFQFGQVEELINSQFSPKTNPNLMC